jgi:hypothetical protein
MCVIPVERAGLFSGTVEHLSRDEHAVACKHSWSMGEHVRMECRLAGHKPPWLDEAAGVLDPPGRRDLSLAREKLRCVG